MPYLMILVLSLTISVHNELILVPNEAHAGNCEDSANEDSIPPLPPLLKPFKGFSRYHPFPKDSRIATGLTEIPKDALVKDRSHAFGTTRHVVEGSEQLRLLDLEKHTDLVESSLIINRRGFVLFINHTDGFRNTAEIPIQTAIDLINTLKSRIEDNDIMFAYDAIYEPLKEALGKDIEKKTDDSVKSVANAILPVTPQDILQPSIRSRNHAFGSTHILVEPHGKAMTLVTLTKNKNVESVLRITSNGQITRVIPSEEGSSPTVLNDTTLPRTAQGIIRKVIEKCGNQEGLSILGALLEDPIRKILPSLFPDQEGMGTIYFETDDGIEGIDL